MTMGSVSLIMACWKWIFGWSDIGKAFESDGDSSESAFIFIGTVMGAVQQSPMLYLTFYRVSQQSVVKNTQV